MCKKFMMVGAITLLGAATLATTGAWSYVRTGVRTASESVRSSVPVEFQIERARQMIQDLKPEIAENMKVVARERVEVRKLGEQIADKQQLIAKSRDEIMRLKGDLETGSVRFVYAGRKYSADQVKEDLAHRFKQHQVHEATTDKLEQVLAAREKNLNAACMKLDEMLSAKRELEVEVENLQARMTMVAVAQTSSPVSIDDSHLSQTRQLLDDIGTRIEVAEQLVASDGALEGKIQLESPVDESNVLDEIAAYFDEPQREAEVKTLLSSHEL